MPRPLPLEFALELTPRARVDVIDVRGEVFSRYGDQLSAYPRALCCSFHTTAGYLDQGVATRLNQGPDGVMPYIDVFRTMFPEGAGYAHDKIERRTELSPAQRPVEPLNADSHLAFMAGGLYGQVSIGDGKQQRERRTRGPKPRRNSGQEGPAAYDRHNRGDKGDY